MGSQWSYFSCRNDPGTLGNMGNYPNTLFAQDQAAMEQQCSHGFIMNCSGVPSLKLT